MRRPQAGFVMGSRIDCFRMLLCDLPCANIRACAGMSIKTSITADHCRIQTRRKLQVSVWACLALLLLATVPCAAQPLPDLTISKAHTGNFTVGSTGATYTVTVTNSGTGDKAAGSGLSVTDAPPTGLS